MGRRSRIPDSELQFIDQKHRNDVSRLRSLGVLICAVRLEQEGREGREVTFPTFPTFSIFLFNSLPRVGMNAAVRNIRPGFRSAQDIDGTPRAENVLFEWRRIAAASRCKRP